MILAVLVLRVLLGALLPHRTFRFLWLVVLVRLFLPFSLQTPLSIEALATALSDAIGTRVTIDHGATDGASVSAFVSGAQTFLLGQKTAKDISSAGSSTTELVFLPESLLRSVWLTGCAVAMVLTFFSYLYQVRRFGRALPVVDVSCSQWLAGHRLLRRLRVCESDAVDAPVTYGILRPVIVVPYGFDWRNPSVSTLVLEHEFIHVKQWDVAFKVLLAMARCVYWFDPFVWVMCRVANRDIELACDERVARRLNPRGRSLYARSLVDAAAILPGAVLPAAGFSVCALEERVVALGRVRAPSVARGVATVALAALLLCIFGTTAPSSQVAAAEDASASWAVIVEKATSQEVVQSSFLLANGEVATRIVTPSYAVNVRESLFPSGFTWTFSDELTDVVASGASRVLALQDEDSGRIMCVVFCYPLASTGATGETVRFRAEDFWENPGYRVQDLGALEPDGQVGVGVAVARDVLGSLRPIDYLAGRDNCVTPVISTGFLDG